MGRSITMHVDEAPWINGEPSKGLPKKTGTQIIGDGEYGEKAPWIVIASMEPYKLIPPHSHDQDEVIFIVEGSLTIGDQDRGPGTVIFVEKGTEYGFTVGGEGVRFLNIRPGLATVTMEGKTWDSYREAKP